MSPDAPTAIVTGAAGGIGRAAAIALASQWHARVGLLDIDPIGLEGTRDALDTPSALATCDVSDENSVRTAVSRTRDELGPITILVNAAGVCLDGSGPDDDGPAHRLEIEPWHRTIGVNLTGCFLMSKHVLADMRAEGNGAIVHVASIGGNFFGTHNLAYAATKAGVAGMTRSMAAQYGPQGIRTNCICPGPVDTPMSQMARAEGEDLENWLRAVPLRRIAEPDEIGTAIAFLAGTASSYLNGSVITADGGMVVA